MSAAAFDATFDSTVHDAWQEFSALLGRRMSSMSPYDTAFITPSRELAADRWFALRLRRSRRLRCAVAGGTAGHAESLVSLGWRRVRDGRLEVTTTPGHGDDAVVDLAVRTLRQVWSVPDPSFLAPLGHPLPERCPILDAETLGPDGLRALVRDELETYAGGTFTIRPDATIALPTAHIDSAIGISLDEPRIDIFGKVLVDAHPRFTDTLIADLATRCPTIELVLDDAHLWAVRSISAVAFHRHRLFLGLSDWLDFIDRELPRMGPTEREPLSTRVIRPATRGRDKPVNRQPLLRPRTRSGEQRSSRGQEARHGQR
ncbi:hypothetical protein GDN83_20045 [Gordonia jinghuaiqii]|uniref:TY-Chap N-terminal domain-containing protein n=1 Tax=Gordonia jinghuaiqii TaxID=2758710 RepID=A0A7D7LY60_9ACTN|nr:hypothetical protein [Gordonia jinghuaiqii]MCR5980002.1 hypothetical protein [Gordonia jinghuaiqii]QMT03195.1 hypothetical protein H1R19_08865 [Gordonia jinghuaiqii]